MKKIIMVIFILGISKIALSSNEVDSLDDITVVGTKSVKSTFEVSGKAYDLKTNTAENQTITDIFDVFQNTASINVGGSARTNGKGFVMRGYGPASNITLIDGVRQNFYSAHDGLFFISQDLISSVDVSLGASSALYGNGGLSGVVGFNTIEAENLLKEGKNYGGFLSSSYNSENSGIITTAATYGSQDRFDYVLALSYDKSGNIKLPKDAAVDELIADEKIMNLLTKFNYKISENSKISFQNIYYQGDINEPNNPQLDVTQSSTSGSTSTSNYSDFNYDVNKDLVYISTSLKYSYDNVDNNLVRLNTNFYYNSTSIDEEIKENKVFNYLNQNGPPSVWGVIPWSLADEGDILSRKITTFGINADNTSIVENINTTFIYGIEAYQDKQDGNHYVASNDENKSRGGSPDAISKYYGAFIQGDSNIFDKINLIYGIRYDGYASEADTDLENSSNAFSPKVSLNYMPSENGIIYLSYAQGFRAPHLTELYAGGEHYPTNNFIPNENLKPETNQSFEAGFGYKNSLFRLKASSYYTLANNYIDMLIVHPTTQYVNVDEAYIYGGEIELNIHYNNWYFLDISYGFSDGKDSKTEEYLENLTPHTVVINEYVKVDKIKSIFGVRMTAVYRQDHVSSNYEDIIYNRSGYATWDAYYSYKPIEDLSFDVGIDNIFDKVYSNIPFPAVSPEDTMAPGRSYKVKATYSW